MSLIVQKFGGTSVGSIERIEQVADKIAKFRKDGHDIVVVVSAMSGETNRLIQLARDINDTPAPREMDVLVSTGEQVTTALLCMALHKRDVKAKSYNGSQVRILTDNSHTKARIRKIDDERMHADLAQGQVLVVAGFQGVDEQGNITTLGRGGSDTTAVALAAALNAHECQIYTDVDGVYTTDPRMVDGARRLAQITFEEMLEMASMGSKVLQIRAVEFAGKYNVPLRVLHSFEEGPVGRDELARAEAVLNRVCTELKAREVRSDNKIAKVSVVGVGMRSHAGVASQMFAALAEVGINIQMITTSEIKISVIIEEKFLELAVRALHSSFELEKEPLDESAD
ncbi:UNVERIFIED_CONTAM: hypothetical protein GTU68_008101 [Idotea baltica]|nr:hypothetical protein [Idotea baltica]